MNTWPIQKVSEQFFLGMPAIEINGRGNSLRSPHNTLYPQKLALTSSASGDRSVGIVRLRIKATEFSSVFFMPATE
jgi:hypothetical protein